MQHYIDIIRQISLDNKYTKWYLSIISKNQTIDGYSEMRHIVPKSFGIGGESDVNNLVKLTPKQHYICHLLLAKMFNGKYKQKMIYAFRGLVGAYNKNQDNRYTSNLYHKFKSNMDNKRPFVKLYTNDSVKYIHPCDVELIDDLINNGWSKTMPDEYKIGRVGNMLGKQHSNETKLKMSASSHKIRNPLTNEHKNNISSALIGREVSDSTRQLMTEKLKSQYANGTRTNIGDKNPNYGRRKIINIISNETMYVKLIDLDEYLRNGWELKRKPKTTE